MDQVRAELLINGTRSTERRDSARIIAWEADAKTWRFTFVGPEAETIFGYPVQQWYERNFWSSHIHPEDRDQAVEFYLENSPKHYNYEFDYRMITADGRAVWIHDIVNVEFADGEPVKLRGYLIDITDRKEEQLEIEGLLAFEKFLSELSTRFVNLPAEAIGEELQVGIRKILEFLRFERATVFDFSEDMGAESSIFECSGPGIPPVPHGFLQKRCPWLIAQLRNGEAVVLNRLSEDLPEEAVSDREYYESCDVKSVVGIPLAAGGNYLGALILDSFSREIDWSQGKIDGLKVLGEILASALARRNFEVGLKRSQGQLSGVMESVPDALLFVRPDGTISDFNEQFEEMFGYSRNELVGEEIDMLLPERYRQFHTSYFERYVANPTIRVMGGQRKLFGLRKNETEFPVEISLRPMDSARGLILCCSIRDTTERLKLEEEARELREELAHVTRLASMSEMAASLAHELNQPLTAIVSNAQAGSRMLSSENQNLGEVEDTLQDIAEDGKRAGKIIHQLRNFMKKDPSERGFLEINEVIREVIDLLHSDVVIRDIAVRLELAPGLPEIHGDRIQLQQVILNLVLNASQAMAQAQSDRRDLLIESKVDAADSIEISVSDSGQGIDEEVMQRMFTPFYTTKSQGMGMGLAINRTIVESHGGKIWAQNRPSGGATVAFTLPTETKAQA